jgi:sugar lactone lactonase YvrE
MGGKIMASRNQATWAPLLAALLTASCTSAPMQGPVGLRNETSALGRQAPEGQLIGDKGGALVSNNAGSLTGVIQGPGANVVARAGQLIANSGASILSPSGATLIANNAAGFRIAAAEGLLAPAAGATVRVVDAQGQAISSAAVTTDATGRYTVSGLAPSGPVVFVEARYEQGGQVVTLLAAAKAPRAAGAQVAAVDPASTMVGRKVASLLKAETLQADAVAVDSLTRAAERLAGTLSDATVAVSTMGRPEDAEATFDRLLAQDAALREEVSAIAGSVIGTPGANAGPLALPEVRVLAGNGQAGFADGPATEAGFQYPYAVAADAAGTLYVADYRNHRIRKVAPDGTVSTLAGSGTAGHAEGQGAAAQFSSPRGLTIDAAGNLYVVDTGNARIRRVTPDGTVSTFAGSGTAGFFDGPAEEAQFNDPRGIAVDPDGQVYVADTGNHRVRRITPEGAVSTFAELPGPDEVQRPSEARLSGPYGVAADGEGRVFVADTTSNTIQLIDADGTCSVYAGNGSWGDADGQPVQASFRSPVALALDAAGHLYVADCFSHRIRRVAPDGVVSTVAGDGTPGLRDSGRLQSRLFGPYGLTLVGDKRLVVADTSNHVLRTVTLP